MPAGFTVDVGDLKEAAAVMARHGCPPGLLIGHSLGGAAAIAAAGDIDSVKAVATIGAPFDVDHVLMLLGPGAEGLRHGETHTASVGGRPVSVGAGFAEDLKSQDQKTRLANLKRALLILHSPVDQVVGIEESSGIFLAAKHPKSFVSLDKADHLLSDPADAAYAATVIAAWARDGARRRWRCAGDRDGRGQVPGQGRGGRGHADGRRAGVGGRTGQRSHAL
jgi:putative redox protein